MSRPWLVIVHSPVLGPSSCVPLARALTELGWRCVVPSLLDATTAVDHVRIAAAGVPAVETVLLGHSGAGRLLPAIDDAAQGRTVGYAFVDSGLPPVAGPTTITEPGFAAHLEQLAVDGLVPRWWEWWGEEVWAGLVDDPAIRDQLEAEMRSLPLTTFTEAVPMRSDWLDTTAVYLRLSRAYADAEADAARRAWPVAAVDGSHLDPALRPRPVADALDGLLRTFT